MIPTNDRKSREPHVVMMVMAIIALAAGLMTVGLLALAEHFEPQVGDIIAFPASARPSVSTASMTVSPAASASQSTCVLDVEVIHRLGGSLVIEAVHARPDHHFQVHWAGVRTSHDRDSCGDSADLLLNRSQVAALIFAAGGKGAKTAQQ
jgi:hypothetical protein